MKDGIVNVLKPAGMTSHDVVNKLRKIYHTRKVGHTGTLDPDAIGVLPVCVGQATRLAEYLTEKDKVYRTILTFGKETNTQDSSGTATGEFPLPTLDRDAFAGILAGFMGDIQQVPPMYSAIKKDGQPLYKLARAGNTVDIPPRTVTIYEIALLMYSPSSAMLRVRCGKGTYIRTLCQDIGRACGSGAHMSFLLREASGIFTMDGAVTLDKLENSPRPEDYLLPMTEALRDMPTVTATDPLQIQRLGNGLSQRLPAPAEYPVDGQMLCKALDGQRRLLAIGMYCEGSFQPQKVFNVGEAYEQYETL